MGVSIITFLLLRVFVDESRDTGPLSIFDKILPGSNSNSSSNKRLKVSGAPSEITKIRPFFLEKFELEFLPEDPAEKSTPPGEGKGRRSSICSCL